jgi:hypothetical protein
MHTPNVDVVRAKPLKTSVGGTQHPSATEPPLKWLFSFNTSDFCREYPIFTVPGNDATDDALGIALAVAVGCIDEVYAALARKIDDLFRLTFTSRVSKYHGPNTQR